MILDLFRGPGGWSEGLRALGLADHGIELCPHAHATATAAGHAGILADVAALDPADLGPVDGLIASPPCQAWSRAGLRGGIHDQALVHRAVADLAAGHDTRADLLSRCRDPRSLLAAEPMRYLRSARPTWVAMEEVPDVLPLWRQYVEILRSWGYSAWAGILNAADYGVPQTRRRAILIASMDRAVAPPEPTHAEHPEPYGLFGPGRAPWVGMAQALGWASGHTVNTRGDRRTPGGNEFPADGPSWALTEKTRSWALRNNTQSNASVRGLDEPAGTLFFGARGNDVSWILRNGNQPNAAERAADEPAPTMTFGHNAARVEFHSDTDTVRITVVQAAVLQGFRPDYPWQGSRTKKFQQVGNAVPPLLAAHVVAAATGLTDRLAAAHTLEVTG